MSRALHTPTQAGRVWVFKCCLLAGGIAAGWAAGQLQTVSLAIIGGYVWIQGIRPYFAAMRELEEDIDLCRGEAAALRDISVDQAEDVLQGDPGESGSVFKILVAILTNRGRAASGSVVERFLGHWEAYWQTKLSPLAAARNEAPVLGLGGSLLGIIAALGGLSGLLEEGGAEAVETLFPALATMSLTTLAGCAGYLVLNGLHAIAENAVDAHEATLRQVGLQFSTGGEDDEDGIDLLDLGIDAAEDGGASDEEVS